MKPNTRVDTKISKLVEDVQSYCNPTGQYPTPPTDRSPESRSFVEPPPLDRTGPDRSQPPDWFIPGGEFHVESNPGLSEVPAIADQIDVPETSEVEEETMQTLGVEALAFYAPFHFYQRHQWGIYVRDFGLVYLASKFLRRHTLTTADNWVLRCAFEFLREHEYFHFQTELAVGRYEILMFQESMYLDHAYLHHSLDRHSSWLEESVANAQGYRRFSRRRTIGTRNQIEDFKSFLVSWMNTQPPGYRDYGRWIGRTGLTNGRFAITSHLHESLRHWRRGKIESDPAILDLYREAEYSQVPIMRVRDARLATLKSARPFPKAHGMQVSVFSNDHPPPHIHVDFLDGERSVRVEWPSLMPLKNDRELSRAERRSLAEYLKLHQAKILQRLRTVFSAPSLPAALG